MKKQTLCILTASTLLFSACANKKNDSQLDTLLDQQPKWQLADHWRADRDGADPNQPTLIATQRFVDEQNLKSLQFNTPFLVREKSIVTAIGVSGKAEDTIFTQVLLLDCANLKFARVYEETQDHDDTGKARQHAEVLVDLNKAVDASKWNMFLKGYYAAEQYCAKAPDFKAFNPPKNDTQKDWKLTTPDERVMPNYINKEDLKHARLDQPFPVRMKRYDEFSIEGKAATSVVNEVLINCKEQKVANIAQRYYADDFEFKPNTNPTLVTEFIEIKDPNHVQENQWYSIGKDYLDHTGICSSAK